MASFKQTANPADIDLALLAQARERYEQARLIALQRRATPDLQTRVEFGLGEYYLAQTLVTNDIQTYNMAREAFESVILDYADGGRPRLQELAGEAHARLGLMYKESNKDCALKEYDEALSLLSNTNPNRADYEEAVKDLTGEQANSDLCTG
jgi:tetratricopeptide (TPR) repeat protein